MSLLRGLRYSSGGHGTPLESGVLNQISSGMNREPWLSFGSVFRRASVGGRLSS